MDGQNVTKNALLIGQQGFSVFCLSCEGILLFSESPKEYRGCFHALVGRVVLLGLKLLILNPIYLIAFSENDVAGLWLTQEFSICKTVLVVTLMCFLGHLFSFSINKLTVSHCEGLFHSSKKNKQSKPKCHQNSSERFRV